jgi:phage repressor protein C with HTH and peptisase S24 domain
LETSKEQAADQQSKQETAEFIASTQLSADENFAKSSLEKFKNKEITETELKTAQNAVKTSTLVLDRVRKGELASVIESPETGKYQVQFVSDVPVAAATKPGCGSCSDNGRPCGTSTFWSDENG